MIQFEVIQFDGRPVKFIHCSDRDCWCHTNNPDPKCAVCNGINLDHHVANGDSR